MRLCNIKLHQPHSIKLLLDKLAPLWYNRSNQKIIPEIFRYLRVQLLGEQMATQNINIGVNVSDNGTAKKTVKSFQEIEQAATKAQRAAANINVPTGGTSGSRAVAAKAAPSGSERMMGGQEYGQMRGAAGVTGASARDFANQAQGLGGLVRLYATYAANVFAVGAAFTALKNAADTANLIKGMNQLGAASGVAMGTLSKSLVEVTDGAISMREAMETVTKATSSGLSSKQILELGKVAKNASQALGVGMEDAVNRLTRGITKLEPELLDELGIFTKIDPAVQKYALSIGRAASSLTDFERRQAFAIAVLEEGNKKFGELELDANPYAKFLATLKDVGFVILDVVNKAVVPLIDYLSKSPTALLTVLGAVATLIVRQALPAFGQFRAGLESSAEAAQEKAIARARDAAEAQKSISESVRQAADARVEAEVAKVVAAEKRINDIKAGSINKQSALYKILEKDLEDITQKDLKRIDASAKGLETRGLKDQAKAYRDTAAAIRSYQQEKSNYDTALKREQQQLQNNAKWYSIESITLTTAERAKQQAVRASIVSNAAYQASLVGVTRAMIAVNAAIVKQGITGFDAFTLRVKAGAAAIGGALATIGSAINRFLGVIGLLATAYSILDGFLDGASEQVGKFDSSVEKAKSSADNLANTYKKIYENDPFSAQSVQARGNALMEVADSFKEIAESARDAQKAIDQSWWAQLKEGLGISGVARNFGKSIATQLTTVLKTIDDPEAKKLLEDTAKNQLGITEVSFDKVAAAAKRLGASSDEIARLQEVIRGLATQAKIAGAASAQFAESYRKVTEQVQKINQKFAVTDDIALFAINSTNALNDLDNLLSQGVTKSAEGLVSALQGIGRGANIFGNLSSELAPLAADAAEFKKQFSEGEKEVKKLAQRLDELKDKKLNKGDFTQTFLGQTSFDQNAFNKAVAELEAQRKQTAADLAQARQRTDKAKGDLEVVSTKVQQALPRALANSTELLGTRLAGQLAKVSNQVLQGAYAAFDSIPELAAKSSQLKLQEIDAQIANTKALQQLTTATVISAAQQKVTAAKLAATQATGAPGQQAAELNLQEAEKELSLLETAVKNPLEALKLLSNEQLNNTEIAKRLSNTVQDLAARTVEYNVALKQLGQQRLSEKLQGDIATSNARIKQEQNLIKLKQDELKVDSERLQLLASQEGIGLDTKEQLNTQVALNREKQIELNYQQKLLEASRAYAEQAIRASVLPSDDRQTAIANIQSTLTAAQNLAAAQKAQELEKSRLDALRAQSAITIERINREETAFNTAADFDRVQRESALQLKQIKLDTELGVQSALLNNSQISASTRAEIEYQSTLKLAALEQERAKVQANQEFERQATANTFAIRKALAADTGEDGLTEETLRRIREITDQEKVQKANRDAAITQADAIFNKTTLIADATRRTAQEQDRFNQLLKDTASFAESLSEVFGSVGEKLGTIANTLAEVAKNTAERAKAEADLQSARDMEQDPAKRKKLEESLGKQKSLNAKAEMSDNIKVINSTKKLFKEKTAAYKVLDGMEKAMHTYKMLIMAKEVAMDLWKTGQAVINSMTRTAATSTEAAASGTAAVVNQGRGDPYTAFARMAAMAVLVSSILGKSVGGGGGGGAFVPTAQQAQETQGTGMAWDASGRKVETGRGVFGDTEAKNQAIANSLQIIKENSVDGLSYDNRALKALEGIRDAIGGLAISLYNIPGLRVGSMFGTVEGTQRGGGLLGTGLFGSKTSTAIQNTGILINSSFDALADSVNDAGLKFFEDVTITRKKWYGSSRSWNQRNVSAVTDTVQGFFSDIFENARDLFVDVGKKAGMTASEVNNILKTVEFKRVELSTRGLKGEALEKEISAVIGDLLDISAEAVFGDRFEKYRKFGEELTTTVIRVVDSNEKVRQQLTNIMGKSFEDTLNLQGVVRPYKEKIEYTLSAVGKELRLEDADIQKLLATEGPGGIWNRGKISQAIANSIRREYLQSTSGDGWEMEATAEFVVGDQLTQNLAKLDLTQDEIKRLNEAGVSFAKKTVTVINDGVTTSFDAADIKDESYDITENFIKLAGGIENFVEQSNFFAENFIPESERLVSTQTTVTKEMERLGFAGVNTREEFKALVQSLDDTTPAGRETYQALMNVAEGFNEVITAAERLADSAKSLQMRILELTGTPEQVLAAQRAETLSTTDPALVPTQEYIFALEDVKAAEEALTKAREQQTKTTVDNLKVQVEALKNSSSSYKRFSESLRQYAQSLLLSQNTTLTPEQQYQEARRRAMQLYDIAIGPAVTPAEQEAKMKALEQLQDAGEDFLRTSRIYNASSQQYAEDFNLVQRALSEASSILSSQATDAEKQLLKLEQQITQLETINSSVLSVADALDRLAAAQERANSLKGAAETAINQATTAVGANIQGNIVYGAQGSSTTIEQGKADIQTWLNTLNNYAASGNYTTAKTMAADLYRVLKTEWGLTSTQVAQILGIDRSAVLDFLRVYDLPVFAKGTNYVPNDMVAQIHEGERIIPAADNAELMQSISNRNETNRVLVEEIKNLRREVQQLRDQQAKETGNIIVATYDAQQRNAEQIGEAMNTTAQQTNWNARVREAVKLK